MYESWIYYCRVTDQDTISRCIQKWGCCANQGVSLYCMFMYKYRVLTLRVNKGVNSDQDMAWFSHDIINVAAMLAVIVYYWLYFTVSPDSHSRVMPWCWWWWCHCDQWSVTSITNYRQGLAEATNVKMIKILISYNHHPSIVSILRHEKPWECLKAGNSWRSLLAADPGPWDTWHVTWAGPGPRTRNQD